MTDETKYLAAGAVVVGGLVRALKTDAITIGLANLGLPPLPKRWLPWLSLIFGFVYAVILERQLGKAWEDAVLVSLVAGTAIGGTAAYGHDLGKAVPGVGKMLGVLLVVGFAASTSACTPQARWAVADLLASKIACAVSHQDLPNDMIVKACALEPGDVDRVLAIVGESRSASAKAASDAAARAGAAKCVASP